MDQKSLLTKNNPGIWMRVFTAGSNMWGHAYSSDFKTKAFHDSKGISGSISGAKTLDNMADNCIETLEQLRLNGCLEEYVILNGETGFVIENPFLQRFDNRYKEQTDAELPSISEESIGVEKLGTVRDSLVFYSGDKSVNKLSETNWEEFSDYFIDKFFDNEILRTILNQGYIITTHGYIKYEDNETNRAFPYKISVVSHDSLDLFHMRNLDETKLKVDEIISQRETDFVLKNGGHTFVSPRAIQRPPIAEDEFKVLENYLKK